MCKETDLLKIYLNKISIGVKVFFAMVVCYFYFNINNSSSAERLPVHFSRTQYLMGTLCTVEITSLLGQTETIATISEVFHEIARLENIMSTYRAESEMSKLNNRGQKNKFVLSQDLYDILVLSYHYSILTGGDFDVTVYPLMHLWKTSKHIPDEEIIRDIRKSIGFRFIKFFPDDRSIIFKNPATRIDLGGIAKGYALDKIGEILKRKNIEAFFINFGGQILTYNKSHDTYEKITIAHPQMRDKGILEIFVNNVSISTTGNAERHIKIEGRTFGHIINPKTGFPVSRKESVTVISQSATEADVLSTALFVMGTKEGLQFANSRNICAIFIAPGSDEKTVHFSYSMPCEKLTIKEVREINTFK